MSRKGLQTGILSLKFGTTMLKFSKVPVVVFYALVAAFFCSASLADPVRLPEFPSERPPEASPAKSFLERYSSAAQDVLLKGLELVGIGYRAGGVSSESGLDCSGYVQTVFREAAGLVLPRTAREQAQQGREIDRAELKPGDLVFFNTMRRAFSHVGIYLGDNYFLHSPSAGSAVRLESMQNSYWTQRYNGARRVIHE
jgi:cell wall-associated NlpC family hydrolase